MRAARAAREGAPAPPGPWRLEVQVHPGDIRRRVRYYFLSRAHLTAWCLAALACVAVLALGLGVAPRVVGAFLGAHDVQRLLAERARQGERLQALVGQMEEARGRAGDLRLQVQKVGLAYGVPEGAAPPPAAVIVPAPESIYAGTIQHGRRLARRVRGELAATGALVGRVAAHERADAGAAPATPALCPLRGVDFVLLSPFGRRRNTYTDELQFHTGVDLAAPPGSPIVAPADGTVVFAGRYPMSSGIHWWRLGELVAVRHGERFLTLYGHCREVLVRRGQRVRRGEVLATVGNTGWSTSPHLHYEVQRRDAGGDLQPLDPRLFMLDHRWRDDERLVVRAGRPPGGAELPALPAAFRR